MADHRNTPIADMANESRSAATDAVEGAGKSDGDRTSIPKLLKIILLESTEYLRRDKLKEIKRLTAEQSEIDFLNNLRRVFKLGGNDDGSFTVNDDLKKILSQVSAPGSENLLQLLGQLGITFNATYTAENFQGLFAGIEALDDNQKKESLLGQLSAIGITKEQKPSDAQLASLIEVISKPENLELRKHVTSNNILTTKESFSKLESENFVESIAITIQQKTTLNEMSFQRVTELESTIKHREQLAISAAKIYNDLVRSMASKIGK